MSSPNEDLTHAIKILLMNWGPYKTKGKLTFSQCGPAPVRPRREVGRGGPTGFHEGPLQKPLEFLVFLRGRLWNSTGGHSAQDADLTHDIKILLMNWGPYKTKGKCTFSQYGPRPRRCSGGADQGTHVRIATCVSNAPHGNH